MMHGLVVVFLCVTGLSGCQNGSQNLGSDLNPTDIANNNRGVGLMGRFEYDTARQLFAHLAEQQPDRLDVRVNLAIATLNR